MCAQTCFTKIANASWAVACQMIPVVDLFLKYEIEICLQKLENQVHKMSYTYGMIFQSLNSKA